MTSLKQLYRDQAEGEPGGWMCQDWVEICETLPGSVQTQYDLDVGFARFQAVPGMTNPTKCKAMVLQFIGELADETPDGDVQDHLNAIATDPAAPAVEQSWAEGAHDGKSESVCLVKCAAVWLQSENGSDLRVLLLCLLRAYAQVRKSPDPVQDQVLYDLARSRCPIGEWSNGYGDE